MLSSDEGDIDVFFDSADCLSPQESALVKEDLGSNKFDYEIWVKEPQSVRERRKRFLEGLGLDDISEKMVSFDASSNTLGMERMTSDYNGAVSNACISPTDQVPEKLVPLGCKAASEAKVLFEELKGCQRDEVDISFQEHRHTEAEAFEGHGDFDTSKKKKKNWWKRFVNKRKVGGDKIRSKQNIGTNKSRRMKVRQNKKRWMEFSGLYIGQEIRAHKGLIWTMKFSPDGQYLASGGEDGIVRIWRVKLQDTSSNCFTAEDSLVSKVKQDMFCSWKKQSSQNSIFLPRKVFQIEELPLQEFYGHSSDVLDLAWSNSDILLSSSMDKTVRLWQIGCNQCLSVFRHTDYVTCIQVNPVDESYFISGSIDGKVRIWGVHEERVVDWADIHDVISAISYQPDGKGFVVGSISGTCRFYVASGKHFQLEAQICVDRKKRSGGNKITGIQFSQEKHQRVLIASEDSKLRLLEGIDVVQKFRGLPKSGSQMSGSFTSGGKHIISVGEDCRVYIWNLSDMENGSSKHTKSNKSCEYFFSEGVTVAIPWSGMSTDQMASGFAHCCSEMQYQMFRDLERCSRGNWFSIDGTSRGSMTWPEEKLPSWDSPRHQLCPRHLCDHRAVSEAWGQSIVAAGCDGTIKTFHNFGLPVRL